MTSTRLYRVRYDGQDYVGPQLTQILNLVNSKLPNPEMHLTQTCMSLVVRGKSRRGFHKGASGEIFTADKEYVVPEGTVWVPAYQYLPLAPK
jgi:hypothetical protein